MNFEILTFHVGLPRIRPDLVVRFVWAVTLLLFRRAFPSKLIDTITISKGVVLLLKFVVMVSSLQAIAWDFIHTILVQFLLFKLLNEIISICHPINNVRGHSPCSPASDSKFGIDLDFICDTFVADFGMLYTGVQGM